MGARPSPAVVAAGLYLAYSAVATLVAYEFGGRGDPADVSGEWVAHGTGLSAPLAPLVGLAACAVLALRRDRWWGLVGTLGIAALGALFLVAGAGEGVWPDRFGALAKLLQAVGFALAAALVVLGLVELVGWWRRRAAAARPEGSGPPARAGSRRG